MEQNLGTENEDQIMYAEIDRRDQGWAWLVLFTSFIMQAILDGTISGFGVLYTGMRNDSHFLASNITADQLTLPGAIQSSLYMMSMIFVSPMIKKFGFQWATACGGLLTCGSMAVASQVNSFAGFLILYGILAGFGLGMLNLCAIVSVTHYFDQYRAVACGIAGSGNGFGYIIVPLLLNIASQRLNWRYSLLIFSSSSLLIFILAALTLKPIMVLPIMRDYEKSNEDSPKRISISDEAIRKFTKTGSIEMNDEHSSYLETVTEEDTEKDIELSDKSDSVVETVDSLAIRDENKNVFGATKNTIFSSLPTFSIFGSQVDTVGKYMGDPWNVRFKSSNNRWKRKSLISKQSLRTASFGEKKNSIIPFPLPLKRNNNIKLIEEKHNGNTLSSSNAQNFPGKPYSPMDIKSFRRSSQYFSGGFYVGKPVALNPLCRSDSLYCSSLMSLRFHDKQIRDTMNAIESECFEKEKTTKDSLSNLENLEQYFHHRKSSLTVSHQCDIIRSLVSLKNCGEIENSDSTFQQKKSHGSSKFVNLMKESFDLKLFCKLDFWIITWIYIFTQFAYFVPFVYLIDYANESGLSEDEGVYLIAIIGISNTIGRCISGVLGAATCLNTLFVSAFGCCLTAGSHYLLALLPRKFMFLAIYAGLYGFTASICPTLVPVILVRFLGLHRLTSALGNANFLRGIAAAIGPILAGWLKSSTNRNLPVFQFCGSCFLFAGFIHLIGYRKEIMKKCRK